MSLKSLLDNRLPMNRKERFFTGTVFPMVVACEDFEFLDRFLELCGIVGADVSGHPDDTNVQFFTEYGFAESRFGDAVERFATVPAGRDTPDMLILVEGEPTWLVGVEAKMYDTPSTQDLNRQLAVQVTLLEGIATDLPTDVEVRQVALLPEKLAKSVGKLNYPVVTWEQVADAYEGVAPEYWIAMLRESLGRYDVLVSTTAAFGQNREALMSGQAIVDGHSKGQLDFTWMGRAGGIHGANLRDDLESAAWRSRKYEVRRTALAANPNWFPISAFTALMKQHVDDGSETG